MSLAIRGLGTALPGHSISQAEAAKVARAICCDTEEQAALLPNLYKQTGITRRHMIFRSQILEDVLHGTRLSNSPFLPAGPGDHHGPGTEQRMQTYSAEALPLALNAAAAALRRSELSAGEVTHLVTVSCTGFQAPGVDIGLMNGLGLAPTVERVHVGFMGCHGAVNGLRVARAFADADAAARVLLCAVELCSLHYYYGWDPKKLVANALFADGAAAAVGVSDELAPADAWRVVDTGSYLFPNTAYAMTWDIGDHGFDMTLSTRVPGLIAGNLRPWLAAWLKRHGLAIEAIGSWAVHPGGPRILGAVEEGLGLKGGALAVSREVLADCGNMSSPTVLFILDRLRDRGAVRPCVILGFGPGLMAEAALIR